MKTGNDEILIQDIQDERIWIHSKRLGYGSWIMNNQLILENQSIEENKSKGELALSK